MRKFFLYCALFSLLHFILPTSTQAYDDEADLDTLISSAYQKEFLQSDSEIATSSFSFERELYKVRPGNYRYPRLVFFGETEEDIHWVSSDPAIAQVSQDGAVYGVSYGEVTITATGQISGYHASCQVSVCDVRQVAITFDDGPSCNTSELLDYLGRKDIKVTFFLIGNLISQYPDTVARQAAEGHELGYHSYNHKNQCRLSSQQITADFETTNSLLRELTGSGFTLWRSPGGNYDRRVLDCVQLPHICWSVDTRDWETKDPDDIYRQIMKHAKDGSIILLHDIYDTSIDGAIQGINALAAAGYEFLTVSELLARNGEPVHNCVNYNKD